LGANLCYTIVIEVVAHRIRIGDPEESPQNQMTELRLWGDAARPVLRLFP
jgi:hypothetical protein